MNDQEIADKIADSFKKSQALSVLEHGARYPYGEVWPMDAPPDFDATVAFPAKDWAQAAARGVASSLKNSMVIGYALQEADDETRKEISETMADIIRAAPDFYKTISEVPKPVAPVETTLLELAAQDEVHVIRLSHIAPSIYLSVISSLNDIKLKLSIPTQILLNLYTAMSTSLVCPTDHFTYSTLVTKYSSAEKKNTPIARLSVDATFKTAIITVTYYDKDQRGYTCRANIDLVVSRLLPILKQAAGVP